MHRYAAVFRAAGAVCVVSLCVTLAGVLAAEAAERSIVGERAGAPELKSRAGDWLDSLVSSWSDGYVDRLCRSFGAEDQTEPTQICLRRNGSDSLLIQSVGNNPRELVTWYRYFEDDSSTRRFVDSLSQGLRRSGLSASDCGRSGSPIGTVSVRRWVATQRAIMVHEASENHQVVVFALTDVDQVMALPFRCTPTSGG